MIKSVILKVKPFIYKVKFLRKVHEYYLDMYDSRKRIFPNYPPEYIIDKKRKLVFFVIPKNACSSIKTTFCEKEFQDDYSVHKVEYGTCDGIIRKNTFGYIIPKHYFAFAFVRNPFERLYSAFKSKFIVDKNKKIAFWMFNVYFGRIYCLGYLSNIKNFHHFVNKIRYIPKKYDDQHWYSQYDLLFTKNKTNTIDFIGKFEHLTNDFEPIRKKYNLKPLPHFNKSQDKKEEWKDFYTKKTARIIYKRYKKDFDTWYPNAYKELMNYIDGK